MSKSNYLEDAILNHVLRNTALTSPTDVYVALSTADPTEDGSGLTEPTGSWYSRETATFGAPSSGSVSNSSEIDYTNGGVDTVTADDDAKTVTHFAIMDAQSGGNMLYHDALDDDKTLNTGDEVVIPVGDLTVTEE